ncbi:hypothetical protein ILUMI_15872 [Ignelater luminosus]|uniref:DDE Tnp4 domain-containing protein n=1 Tax=Ignelater luminosus TaxID=2038154 RepID=A0A8K0CRE2_IGNLU|nr:hypothetical protein ILUMI_15872 [Ignelater luminosus]
MARREKKNYKLLLEHPATFRNYLRMTNSSFLKLLAKVEPYFTKQDINERMCFCKAQINDNFAIFSRETFQNLLYSTRVHESTIAKFVPVISRTIYATLIEDYIKIPKTQKEWEEISEDFYKLWQIPNTIGALDGRHIAFSAPVAAGSTYNNYKGFNSIVLLALTDASYTLMLVLTEGIVKLVDKEVPLSGLRQQDGNHPSPTAMDIRDEFKNYFNGVGAVEWQNNMV